ncbi:MAG: hypothetical protein A2Z03_04820 [Chloroflexi bacterium RBG_16_56_8]|nr:MAG: hypothetical protein A2Z03_04820 [Chloroflexi bacterium RBG_16_56_8]
MNWHKRYLQQAGWTRDLRAYLFEKTKLALATRILEVGCGTGAILGEISSRASLHGLDHDASALAQCRVQASSASLVRGDARDLPYSDEVFDIVYCHFLLLWVDNPLQALLEMKRVTRPGGHILALAEPDYTARLDRPDELAVLGQWQTASLRQQGADPGCGRRLAESFHQAGIEMIETGTIRAPEKMRMAAERESEWAVIEYDLAGFVTDKEIQKMKALDKQAWEGGERLLHIPTYFAWGRIQK